MAKRRSDTTSLASALYGYGGVLIRDRRRRRAEPLLIESARLDEEIGDKNGMAEAANALGRLRTHAGALRRGARLSSARASSSGARSTISEASPIALNNVGHIVRGHSATTSRRWTISSAASTGSNGSAIDAAARRCSTTWALIAQAPRRLRPRSRARAAGAGDPRSRSRIAPASPRASIRSPRCIEAQGNYGAALEALAKSLRSCAGRSAWSMPRPKPSTTSRWSTKHRAATNRR